MLPKVEIKKKYNIKEHKISNYVFSAIEGLKTKKPYISENIEEFYKTAVGKEVAEISSIIKYQNGELTVKIKNVILKTEMKFREEEIKNSINCNKNEYLLVNKIIFK